MACHQKTLPGTLSIPNLLIGGKRQGEVSLLITIPGSLGFVPGKILAPRLLPSMVLVGSLS